MNVIISTLDELQELQKQQSWILPGNKRIELKLAELSEPENQNYQFRLNKLINSCGCTSGAVLSIASVIFYLGVIFLSSAAFYTQIGTIFILLLIFFMGGILGKISGLIYSHQKLKWTIKKLNKRISFDR